MLRRPYWSALLTLAASVPQTALAAPVPADHQCMGQWVGSGRNTGFPTSWTIDLNLTSSPSGGRCGTIEYTNPACGGFLDNCELVGQDIHTRENYTHAEGNCAPAGRVIIRCEGDRMRYSWIGWEQVDSILHRPGASEAGPTPPPIGPPGQTQPPALPGQPPQLPTPPGQTQPPTRPPSGTFPTPTGPGPTPTPAPPPGSTGGCGLPGCAVAGVPAAGAAVPCAAMLAVWLLRRRRRAAR